ncbi:hypothetical protein N0V84_002841 [Fusarium piperis]|uniref:Uncharacterized protein n=1 Tax=Fusarium piperis TaxID=1435070 RepID=A0A9W8WIF2_9HYPO|nr:hypothetical protein N0V84_002841 [Fusarium piperis]
MVTSRGLFLLALCSVAFAAECFQSQKRTTTIPTADQIRAVFQIPGLLEDICDGNWRIGNEQQLQNTFNHGWLWGGFWTFEGELYNISNANHPHSPLLSGDDGGPGNLEPNSGPCDYPKHNPATFVDSDAAQYLQDFLAANGDGTAEEPSCDVIPSNNCFPSKDCREYTSTEFYYVRLVSGLVNQFFARAHEELQDQTILHILAIDKIIADFKPNLADGVDPNILNTMAGALTMAGAVAGAAPGPAGDILNLFGGVMTIAGANIPAPKPVADDWDPTAVILSMPWMGESESVNLHNALDETVRLMNQGLVGAILKAMGYLVIAIKNLSEFECSEKAGAQYIDNDCYAVSTGCHDLAYKDMDTDKIKLLPTEYGIDMIQFFKNVRECRGLGADPDPGAVSDTAYPVCFFNLDFKETNLYHGETCPLPEVNIPCTTFVYHKPCG